MNNEAVEMAIPVSELLKTNVGERHHQIDKIHGKPVSDAPLGPLTTQVKDFLDQAEHKSGLVQTKLTDRLLAQECQNLTGQINRRVITRVGEVETSLIDLVRLSGADRSNRHSSKVDDHGLKGGGPAVPGVGSDSDWVNRQDDVDDLLLSLGF
ncbi:MAG TPA: hypothetical protein EYN26_00100 [Chromatiales bacterium]|nr:hypothetical protein [Chromatiales bacterium]